MHPSHLMNRLNNATTNEDRHAALWQIINDIFGSFELALCDGDDGDEALVTVKDYVANYYGDN